MPSGPGWFRIGVGAVIRFDGKVLACERADHPGSWQLPQGGIDPDDATVEDALFREVEEETGFPKASLVIRGQVPFWVGYELPDDRKSAKTGRGQAHRWFFLDLRPGVSSVPPALGREFRNWKWVDLAELATTVVEFRRPVYCCLVEHAARIQGAHRDRETA